MLTYMKPVAEISDLKRLVRSGEGLETEFKLKTNHPEKIMKEVVAFANTSGGKLIIGVSDDGRLSGLKFPEEDRYILEKAMDKYIYPMVDYEVELVKLPEDKSILIYDIKPSPFKPHYVAIDGNSENRKAYVRVADKSIQASKEVREILKGQRKSKELRFVFGAKEKLLMEYLEENQSITITKFSEIANIPRRIASRTLVLLCLTSVLHVQPQEGKEDKYVLLA